MPLTRQHHKRALVTGGSRGICCATVRRAARGKLGRVDVDDIIGRPTAGAQSIIHERRRRLSPFDTG